MIDIKNIKTNKVYKLTYSDNCSDSPFINLKIIDDNNIIVDSFNINLEVTNLDDKLNLMGYEKI